MRRHVSFYIRIRIVDNRLRRDTLVYMDNYNPNELPLIKGGQGRSGATLETDTVVLLRVAMVMLTATLLVWGFTA